MKWYDKAVIYEIYVPSFCDSNNDGIGDIKGIISKLDYLKDLGISCIWLTPIFLSPKVDNGYDVADYYQVDPCYGTNEDLDLLILEIKKRDMKIILDIVLNHTSSDHIWFKEACKSRNNPYYDYFIWGDEIPNNWESFFGGSAWEYNEPTNSYYYHAFAKEQVDLNWTNPKVKEEMFNVLKYWLDKGINGFRLDVINFLKTDLSYLFKDNPHNEDGSQEHIYDKDHIETINVIKEIRTFVDNYEDIYLLGEIGSEEVDILAKYADDLSLHSVFNFNLGSIPTLNTEIIFKQIKNNEFFKLPTNFFSSHDMSRHISRLCSNDPDLAKVFATMIMTLRGIPVLFQGDEIGMHDYLAKDFNDFRDIQAIMTYQSEIKKGLNHDDALLKANERCRDKSRSPIQWNSDSYSGFSKVKPWLDVVDNYPMINATNSIKDPNSLLNLYKDLIKLRDKEDLYIKKYNEIFIKQDSIIYQIDNILIVLVFNNTTINLDKFKIKEILLSTKNRLEIKDNYNLTKEAIVFKLEEVK